jgi:predicted phage terminase large subunit-like protein
VLFPAWYLGRHPNEQVMQCSHTASLALDFGRDTRNLMATSEYQGIFPGVSLSRDAKAAYRWNTQQGGKYFAVGKTGAAAGRGGNLVIIDDPHSEQDVLSDSKAEFKKTWQWYLAGPRQRLQPGAAILVVMTRWGQLDLTGQLRRQAVEDEYGEQWEVIELPAILPSGDQMFPEFWPKAELEQTRATIPVSRWMANYQQRPVSEEGAIIKREWWQDWTERDPPSCKYKVQAWDTAFSTRDDACRSAMICWGVFERIDKSFEPARIVNGIILLDAWVRRVDFPTLKQEAKKLYDQHKPDSLVVERATAGIPLIQELWRMGIPVAEANPHRTRDKMIRTNAVADLFSSGRVYAPLNRRWVQEVIEEMGAFPHGEYDDLHDAAVWGLMRLRNGNLIRTASDETEEEWTPWPSRQYY